MKTVPLSDAKSKLSGLIDEIESRDQEVVITRHGKAAAVMISLDQFEGWKETLLIRSDPKLMNEIRKGMAQVRRSKKTYNLDEVFREEE